MSVAIDHAMADKRQFDAEFDEVTTLPDDGERIVECGAEPPPGCIETYLCGWTCIVTN